MASPVPPYSLVRQSLKFVLAIGSGHRKGRFEEWMLSWSANYLIDLTYIWLLCLGY